MIKTDILPAQTKKVFDNLSDLGFKFPLVGGTGLSLQLGHRESVDLDFIKNGFILDNDYAIFKKISKNYQIVYKSAEQVDLFVDDVKITIFSYWWKNNFKLLKYKKLNIWNLKDIAISKCYALGRGEEYKDYIDIYFVLKKRIYTLYDLMEQAYKQYGGDFSKKLFLKQLLSLDKIEDYEINFLEESVSKKQMMIFFEAEVNNIFGL